MFYCFIFLYLFLTSNANSQRAYIFTQLPYINKHDTSELRKLLPDKYDINKRYDLEYRKQTGIVETIIIPTVGDILKAA